MKNETGKAFELDDSMLDMVTGGHGATFNFKPTGTNADNAILVPGGSARDGEPIQFSQTQTNGSDNLQTYANRWHTTVTMLAIINAFPDDPNYVPPEGDILCR